MGTEELELVERVRDVLQSAQGKEQADAAAERVRAWLEGPGAGLKKWLVQMMKDWLPRAAVLGGSEADQAQAEALGSELKGRWVERGLVTILQQQNPMTDVRNLLKALDPEHPALAVVGFSTAEYVAKADRTQQNLEERLGSTVFLEKPEALVERAVWLLGRQHWAEVAAGLVAVTGRRSSEILATATFEPKTRWSVEYSGQLKRRGVIAGATFEIPTLAEAALVVEALARVRSQVDCSKLNARQVNKKYGPSVISAVDHHFAGLVPPPVHIRSQGTASDQSADKSTEEQSEEDNLYTRLFRSVYGAIALHRYCPRRVNDHLFLAEVQGHRKVLDAPDEQVRRSYVSVLHYDDYRVANPDSSISKGTWLGEAVGHGVEVLAVLERFALDAELGTEGKQRRALASEGGKPGEMESSAAEGEAAETATAEIAGSVTEQAEAEKTTEVPVPLVPQKRKPPIAYRVRREDRERLERLRERLALPTQADNMGRVVELAEDALALAEALDVEPGEVSAQVRQMREMGKAQQRQVEDYQRQIQQQREQVLQLQRELEDVQRQLAAVGELERQLQQVRTQLADRQAQIAELEQRANAGAGQTGDGGRALVQIAQELLGLSLAVSEPALRQPLVALATRALLGAGATPTSTEQGTASDRTEQREVATETAGHLSPQPAAGSTDEPASAVGAKATMGSGRRRAAAVNRQQKNDNQDEHQQPQGRLDNEPQERATRSTRVAPATPSIGGGAEPKIAQAVAAIIEHNNQADAWKDKWAITQSALAKLTGSFRPAIQRYLDGHQEEIETHHRSHQLGQLHNGEHHRKQDIREVFHKLLPKPEDDAGTVEAGEHEKPGQQMGAEA